jgi:acetyl-CoA acetyltransferase
MVARRYAHEHGLDEGELTEALGLIAIEHRQNAIRSGRSQHRNELTFDSYLEGRMIADPLRVYDCCPISDGAGAFVVTSLERARQSDRTTHAALLGAGYSSIALTDESFFSQNPGYPAVTTVRPAATRAYSAGLSDLVCKWRGGHGQRWLVTRSP